MDREPFDPTRITVPPEELPRASTEPGRPLTVSQLTRMVKRVLLEHLPASVVVAGELSNVSQPTSGHVYFTLKDASSEVRCVMWRSAAQRLRFEPQDGMEVLATGTIDVYEPRGQYQLYVRQLQPKGLGELELAFRRLREKLQREGLFDPAHKKPLPAYPRCIAVVTSPTGAAIRDIIQTIRRRFPCVVLMLYPVRVQGEGAAREIAEAIGALNAHSARLGGIDLMIVGRGGGSLEDLWAFNEEVVARAIFASRIPVISAVGHETDVTISDLVADVRAPTPTAAAELAVPSFDEVTETVRGITDRLVRVVRHRFDLARRELTAVERFELFRQPARVVRRAEQQLDELTARLSLGCSRVLGTLRRTLHECEVAVGRIHPQALLQLRHRQLTEVEHRLRWSQGARNLSAERHLVRLVHRLLGISPGHVAARQRVTVKHLEDRLKRAIGDCQTLRHRAVEGLADRLHASSHESILRRGFTITRHHTSRRIVTDPTQVRKGDRITTETAGGTFDSRVIDRNQLDLFE